MPDWKSACGLAASPALVLRIRFDLYCADIHHLLAPEELDGVVDNTDWEETSLCCSTHALHTLLQMKIYF